MFFAQNHPAMETFLLSFHGVLRSISGHSNEVLLKNIRDDDQHGDFGGNLAKCLENVHHTP